MPDHALGDFQLDSEELLALALEVTGAGIWQWNVKTGELLFNEAFHRMFGYASGDMPGRFADWASFHHPDEYDSMMDAFNRCVKGESEVCSSEYRLRDKDGKWRWIRTEGKVVRRVGNPDSVWFLGVSRDITDSKGVEQAARERERMLNATGKIARIGGWEHDLRTREAVWTQTLYDIIEMPYDQKPPGVDEHLDYYPDEARKKLEPAYNQAVEKGIPFDLELHVYTAKQRLIWCRAQGQPVFEGGECVAMRGTFQDIDLQKGVELALQESEERGRRIFEHIGSGIAIYEAKDEGEDFIFKDINPAGARIGHKSREEHLGRSVLDVYPGVKELGLFDILRQVWRTGESIYFPISQYKDDAITLWVENHVSRLPSGEVMAAFEDVTGRKRAEDALRHLNEELEIRVDERTAALSEANRELQSFVYSVSHDLRAPLRAISGFAEIIARRHKESLNEEGRHYFNNIVEAGYRMSNLMEDLLSYSRLKKDAFLTKSVDLNRIFKSILSDVESGRTGAGAAIVIAEDLPSVLGVSGLLTQTFTNLVENALIYRREGVAHRVEIDGHIESGHVVVSVKDNGLGIAPEYQEKVFDIFQRLHTHDKYPGTGVGLAIVKKAVSLMKGTVEIESEFGRGSVFRVRLPSAEKKTN